ncbi:DUF2889 domain-containing protein [Phenylobacterium montanum]|uniref:DUF2889 domain-containing protein n=1 Tax=Phenylobacterium montanum TaxID=2823693 RepID=A0A975G3D1_9CAUL|nr:DUF2889 domain-containing protein [Caulobacter sp. S6]QUD90388.1 DUF2889 domain-containing protein [Caulobacter sp. S6]
MNGAFRRAVLIEMGERRIEARLEDDFHRFALTLDHDGREVRRAEGLAERFPWSTCIDAPGALAALEGAKVGASPAELFRHADPRLQCTHLFELSALALAAARDGPGRRLFEAEVSDPDGGVRIARLWRDGALALEWRLEGELITSPPEYAGRAPGAFTAKALTALPIAEAEQLLILRRVVQTAQARGFDVDAFKTAAEMNRPPQCFSLQPSRAPQALRQRGSVRNWPDRASLTASLAEPNP